MQLMHVGSAWIGYLENDVSATVVPVWLYVMVEAISADITRDQQLLRLG
jgi:hypothetical protein